MYTKEDIENLAEFQYLAYCQSLFFSCSVEASDEELVFIEWKNLSEIVKDPWRSSAKIAFDFIKHREESDKPKEVKNHLKEAILQLMKNDSEFARAIATEVGKQSSISIYNTPQGYGGGSARIGDTILQK